jgi:FKBP-type peptidyl-prolyl cis-trans isomerase (trigger factor)
MSTAANVKVSRDEQAWEVEIQAEVPAESFAHYRAQALKEVASTAKLDGFRPGKAPEDAVLRVYGEDAILRHAAEHAIEHELPELLAKEQIAVVEAPRVTTSTPENGKPLTFTARAALAPKIELPDYKSISENHRALEEVSVSDDEHKEALTHLRRERFRIDKMEAGTEPQKAAEEAKAMAEADLPALDDVFVQSLGYADTNAFSEALRQNIHNEKQLRAMEKRRAAILDELVKGATIKYPASLLEYELDDMEARVKDDLARIGRTWEQYLSETKKTREELLDSWKEAADRRAKVRLILGEIARREQIEPDEKAVEHELGHAKQHYPDAKDDVLRTHLAHAMRNDMTLRFLESGEKQPYPAHEHHHDHEH